MKSPGLPDQNDKKDRTGYHGIKEDITDKRHLRPPSMFLQVWPEKVDSVFQVHDTSKHTGSGLILFPVFGFLHGFV